MAYVLALLMAGLSFLLNRLALRWLGPSAVVCAGPLIEEALKTLPAVWLGADVLLTHAGFGAVEAAYDWLTSRRHGKTAAAISLVGHSLFGLATAACLSATGSVALALTAAVVIHAAWNMVLLRLTA